MAVSKTLSANSAFCTMNLLNGPIGLAGLSKTVEKNPATSGSGLSPIPTVVGYGPENLMLEQRSRKMRTRNLGGTTLYFYFELEGVRSVDSISCALLDFEPTVFAVIGSNITKTSGNGFTVEGASTDAFSGATTYSNLQLYDQSTSNIMLWYLDIPTSGSIYNTTTNQFWRISCTPDSTWTNDGYLEISSFFLGRYYDFDRDASTNELLESYSKTGSNHEGSRFYLGRSTVRSLDVSSSLLARNTRIALGNDIKTGRHNMECIMDTSANVDNATADRGRGLIYGYAGNRFQRNFSIEKCETFDIHITESS